MQLSDALLNELQKLLYHEWTISFDNLKAVKSERDDGSSEWSLFYAERLKNATKREAELSAYLKELNPHCPLTRIA